MQALAAMYVAEKKRFTSITTAILTAWRMPATLAPMVHAAITSRDFGEGKPATAARAGQLHA